MDCSKYIEYPLMCSRFVFAMNPKKILFVCVENAGRNQKDEAFFRICAPNRSGPYICGTCPSTTLDTIEAMQEVEVYITKQGSKLLKSEDLGYATKIVNMDCMDTSNCPVLFIDKAIVWQLADPKAKSIEDVRKIRDEIESKIKKLAEYLRNNY